MIAEEPGEKMAPRPKRFFYAQVLCLSGEFRDRKINRRNIA